MTSNEGPAVRPDWMYEVRRECQAFYNQALVADREAFEAAVARCCASAPAPRSLQEGEALRDLLEVCALQSATVFHRRYHERWSSEVCRDTTLETVIRAWAHHDDDPRVTLRRWAEAFLSKFDAAHPSAPVERAAAILRRRFRDPPSLLELAALTARSRSALNRDFHAAYGMSAGEYLTRIRLRWFIDALLTRDQTTTALALQAGYQSYHNLTESLQRRTGLRPRDIRQLSSVDLLNLLHTKLPLSTTALRDYSEIR